MDFENEALKLEAKQWSRSKYRLLVQLLLTRTLVLLLSAFLFSNLVSLFTQLPFLHSYAYSFSTFLLPLFTQILDRKCMFLLCNAIIAFLGACFSSADDMAHYIMNDEHDMLLQPLTVAEPVSEVESGTAASVSYKQNKLLKDDEIVLASRYEAGVEESSGQEEDQAREDVDIKESPTNSEELNNRIEEFIRKMKEDIRLEIAV